jgi:oxygen-independent coproporphyrinogen-3 oxidase
MDRYYELVDAGKLPLDRGIELEPDDLLRREVITSLICNFRLDIKALEIKWRFSFGTHFKAELEDLQQMESDGLLNIDRDNLYILPAGRLLVRNICMVFDAYLRNDSDHSRFSRVI